MFIITVQGQRLNDGISVADYIIEVGQDVCVIQDLSTNQIICTPPETKPNLIQFYNKKNPHVKVGYVESAFKNNGFSYLHCVVIHNWFYSVNICGINVSPVCYVWQVRIGRTLAYDVGYLHYEYSLLDDTSVQIGLVMGIIIVIITITVIVILVRYTRKKRIKRQMEKRDSSILMTHRAGENIAYLAQVRIHTGVLVCGAWQVY